MGSPVAPNGRDSSEEKEKMIVPKKVARITEAQKTFGRVPLRWPFARVPGVQRWGVAPPRLAPEG